VEATLTTGVVASCQENATCRPALADDMAGGWGGQDAVLPDQELLDAVCRPDLRNQLDHLRIPVPAIAANDEKCTWFESVSGGVLDQVDELTHLQLLPGWRRECW